MDVDDVVMVGMEDLSPVVRDEVQVIRRGLDPEPASRYPSAGEFAAALTSALQPGK